MSRALLEFQIDYQIERMFENVWEFAESRAVPWEDVDRAFQGYGINGFDEWWKAGEE